MIYVITFVFFCLSSYSHHTNSLRSRHFASLLSPINWETGHYQLESLNSYIIPKHFSYLLGNDLIFISYSRFQLPIPQQNAVSLSRLSVSGRSWDQSPDRNPRQTYLYYTILYYMLSQSTVSLSRLSVSGRSWEPNHNKNPRQTYTILYYTILHTISIYCLAVSSQLSQQSFAVPCRNGTA
jgi:hypothetical protein